MQGGVLPCARVAQATFAREAAVQLRVSRVDLVRACGRTAAPGRTRAAARRVRGQAAAGPAESAGAAIRREPRNRRPGEARRPDGGGVLPATESDPPKPF